MIFVRIKISTQLRRCIVTLVSAQEVQTCLCSGGNSTEQNRLHGEQEPASVGSSWEACFWFAEGARAVSLALWHRAGTCPAR